MLIQQLAPHVADLIAAGEVVERPASVVKELVENAIDAGASAVVVEIQNGGMTSIRVTDNGCGITRDDLPTAFLRHATSKLRGADDLSAIGTLGFRGEALAAIAAVSRVEIFSRHRDALLGATLSLEGGIPSAVEDAGCPQGTTILVRELFYNTPARLKFMKSDSAEASAVASLLQQMALSHPEVSIQYIRDGKEELHTPGDNKLLSAIYAARGRDFALHLTAVDGGGEDVRVRGFVTDPLASRGSRAMQTFFCCGRVIKSALLTAALEEAYANRQMKGKFPGCVLHIDLPLHTVDVNVHPAKTVVKFAKERAVFSAVHHAVQDALDGMGKPVPTPVATHTVQSVPKKDFYQTMDVATFRKQQENATSAPKATSSVRSPMITSPELGGRTALHDSGHTRRIPLPVEKPVQPSRNRPPEFFDLERRMQSKPSAPQPMPEPEQTTILPQQPTPWRFVGEVYKTYIIAEDGDDLWLIDKHAAHERIQFDRLKANTEPLMRQQLLSSMAVELPREQYTALLEHLSLLEEFGFEVEDFGDGAVLVRAIPADLETGVVRQTLEELAERLLTCGSADPTAARDAMLHTMACKSAIKGGWQSDKAELQVLLDKVQRGEVQFCPHGRPVKVKLTKYEIEKMFKRV